MLKPSILIVVENGAPIVKVLSEDADKALAAYKETQAEAYLFIRPAPSKSKRALAKPDAEPPKPEKPKGKK